MKNLPAGRQTALLRHYEFPVMEALFADIFFACRRMIRFVSNRVAAGAAPSAAPDFSSGYADPAELEAPENKIRRSQLLLKPPKKMPVCGKKKNIGA